MKRAARLLIQERIRRNVVVDPKTNCWLWAARINNQGYPTMSMRLPDRGHCTLFAHRVSLEAFKRSPKAGQEAAHAVTCPHRHCVNPDHLRWATRSENELDKRHVRYLRLREVPSPCNVLGLAE